MKRHWRIQGFDSTTKIFETTIGLGQITVRQLEHLLKALTAKAGLNYSEIVGAYATRRARIANDHLIVHHDSMTQTLWCGNNPHFVASIIDETGNVVRKPKL